MKAAAVALGLIIVFAVVAAASSSLVARQRMRRMCANSAKVLAELRQQASEDVGLFFTQGAGAELGLSPWKFWDVRYRGASFHGGSLGDDIRVLIRPPRHPWSARPRATLAYRVYETDPKTAERRRGLAAMAERLLVDEFGFDPEVGRDIEVVSAEEQEQQREEFERFMEHGIDFTAGRQE